MRPYVPSERDCKPQCSTVLSRRTECPPVSPAAGAGAHTGRGTPPVERRFSVTPPGLSSTSGNKCIYKCKFLYNAVSSPQDCSKHFTLYSLADLYNQTPYRLLWEAFSHVEINARRHSHKYSPLSIARYSFVQQQLEQCRVKKLAQGFTQQHRIRTRVLLVENPMLCPRATALQLIYYTI